MAYNGSGVWVRMYNWQNDAANGIKIRADRMDAEFNDMCNNGLSLVLTRDGQGFASANLPMGGFKHTGAAAATASGQYLVYGQNSGSLGSTSFTGAVTGNSGGFSDSSVAGFQQNSFGAAASFAGPGIQATPSVGGDWFVINLSNGVGLPANGTSWHAYSDETLKTKFVPFTDALDRVSRIETGTGRYLTDPEGVSRSFLSAQSLQEVLPEAVKVSVPNPELPRDGDGKLTASYTDAIPLMLAAFAEVKTELVATKERLAALEARP